MASLKSRCENPDPQPWLGRAGGPRRFMAPPPRSWHGITTSALARRTHDGCSRGHNVAVDCTALSHSFTSMALPYRPSGQPLFFLSDAAAKKTAGAMHHCFPGSFKEPNDHVARRNRPRFIHMQRKGKELCRPANCQSSLTHPDWRARPQPPVKLTWPSRDPSSRARWASPPPQWGQSCRPSARPTRSNPKASSKEMRAYKGRINSKECLRQRGRKR